MNELLAADFFGTPNWKWFALLASIVFLFFFRSVVLWLGNILKSSHKRFLDRSFMQFFLEQKIEKAVSWIVIGTTEFFVIEYLDLPEGFSKYIIFLLKLLLTINIVRMCYMAAEALGNAMQEWARLTESDFDDHLAPFASRTLKVTVVIVGTLIGLQNFGVNVTALLAGLGIGGVALAFAAQDTVANVFGTITIILDRPFKLGDAVKLGDTEGTIEEVGFRSTRIRTYYNSVISIPNSVVAKEKIDNLSLRNGWIRFRHVAGFTYDASLEQIKNFADDLQKQLGVDASVDHNRIAVNLNALADSSLNVLINFHYTVSEGETDLGKIDHYLRLIHTTAAKNRLEFAFPTRTLMMPDLKQLPATPGN